jgi:AcrR family transcriptional regulator
VQNGKPAVSPGPGRRSPALPTDDELLDAALAVFADRGYRQATMDVIAEQANSTKPTLYAHFGGKDSLYQAVFAREVGRLRNWVLAAYATAGELPLEQTIRAYVMALFDYAVAHPESFRMLFGIDSADERNPHQQAVVDTITEQVEAQVRRHMTAVGRAPGPSAGLIAAILVALTGGAARYVQRSGQIGPAAAGELATSFIMAALGGLDPALLDAVDGPGPGR